MASPAIGRTNGSRWRSFYSPRRGRAGTAGSAHGAPSLQLGAQAWAEARIAAAVPLPRRVQGPGAPLPHPATECTARRAPPSPLAAVRAQPPTFLRVHRGHSPPARSRAPLPLPPPQKGHTPASESGEKVLCYFPALLCLLGSPPPYSLFRSLWYARFVQMGVLSHPALEPRSLSVSRGRGPEES